MRLLLADDSVEIRNSLTDYLSFFCDGLEITEVSNGVETLEAFNNSEFDIIVKDENELITLEIGGGTVVSRIIYS